VNQDGAEVQGGVNAQELEKMRARMAEIKQEAATDVDEKWGSPFRTQELFDLKVKTRLSSTGRCRAVFRRPKLLLPRGRILLRRPARRVRDRPESRSSR
jgi:hypothetical protein